MSADVILNERELREARARITTLDDALSSKQALSRVVEGLPPEVVEQLSIMLRTERRELSEAVEAYETAKISGTVAALQERVANDPGLALIVARIAKGYSQRDLAWRLGLKEQQVQRYEADRYRSINLKNYARVAALLGVRLSATIQESPQFRGLDAVIADVSKEDIKKILKHGRAHGWFIGDMDEAKLRRYVAENRIDFGSPTLLRTGLNVRDHSEDILLHAWRARVATRARSTIEEGLPRFDPTQTKWLHRLPALSALEDGPLQAISLLREAGIIVVAEPQIPGLTIDGAAFLEADVPVVGLTIRRDAIDTFWFTLLHECGHVVLHRRTGLSGGFFDQLDQDSTEKQEAEADAFASSLLIPDERWRRSPARISKSPATIEKFAAEVGVHPAIVFGRIRRERHDYTLFSSKIGAGTVRPLLFGQEGMNVSDAPLPPGSSV
jgi:HTH-type transcriptional regulator/antitoxin HigA